ncbi:MAG TPA: transposase [Nitrososphaeraceae archaeon]|nr:transposase [Nitrososphaeraceae archaeon]
MIKWPHNNKTRGRGRPYVYSPTVILKCFIVRIWFRLDSNRALHEYLATDIPYNKKVMKVCGLSRIPSRRTFDRRLASISNDIKNRITIMGELFVHDKIIDTCVLSTDCTLIKAKGYVWHKSSMTEGVVPRSGIDTDAMWGFSHTKGWIFGYKLHMVASTGSIIVPLAADFTTANIPDNQMYNVLAASLPIAIIKKMLYMSADPGYDDHELYDLSTDMGFRLVCPVQRYKNTPEERIKLIEFYESNVGQIIYSLRSISIEPLIGHIKSAFRIDPLPVRGYDTTCAIVLLSVLLYQILVYYNCKTNKDNPMAIKYLLGT